MGLVLGSICGSILGSILASMLGSILNSLFGSLSDRQFGMGYGAIFYYLSNLFLFSIGVAERRGAYGDKFVVSMIIFVILLVVIFIFYPICKLFLLGFINDENSYSFYVFIEKFI